VGVAPVINTHAALVRTVVRRPRARLTPPPAIRRANKTHPPSHNRHRRPTNTPTDTFVVRIIFFARTSRETSAPHVAGRFYFRYRKNPFYRRNENSGEYFYAARRHHLRQRVNGRDVFFFCFVPTIPYFLLHAFRPS